MNNSKNNSFERKFYIIKNTMTEEGDYVDNPKLIDQPTNVGITQPALNKFNIKYPRLGFPDNVKNLTTEQVMSIYSKDYYDNRKIGKIKNNRIANAIFDMGVMSNFKNVGKLVQYTLNNHIKLNLTIDGIIGNKTIDALNNIPTNKIDSFINELKANRLKYLQKLSGWKKYGNGWKKRTNRY